ncbi:MAG: hypothetical protein WBB43_25090 [Limnoraphis sp.]
MDASAILAFLNQESGSEKITDLIENASISTINLSEVIAEEFSSKIEDEHCPSYNFKPD